jgi:nicotinamide-nucleotide amidase
MNVDIIIVGTEYASGILADKKADYLASRITELGLDVYSHIVVGDDTAKLKVALDFAFDHSRVVLVAGVVGQRKNPALNEMIASYFGKKLEENQEIRSFIQEKKTALDREELNVLCRLPKTDYIFTNEAGITPAYLLDDGKKAVAVLPADARELEDVFENNISGYLFQLASMGKATLLVELEERYTGSKENYSEKSLKEALGDLMKSDNPKIYLDLDEKGCAVVITAVGPTKGDAVILSRIAGANISNRLGDLVIEIRETS